MSRADDPFGRGARNRASEGSSIFNHQGDGQMNVNQGGRMNIDNSITNHIQAKVHTWTGWAVVVMLVADVAFFFYGMTAYTGGVDVNGDGFRAFGFIGMVAITISLIRRWFRQRL
ncbi:hypothetical protein [Lentzea sp. HUAS12]|uniref:hypothetical protein n=1 Tax=Lentzea sp. HUAS12 TaxID=2951806 RepID=UPI00209FD592|nr:hypothetical protein [Lentzea sp. HUAS12]USX53014.1 hypothetical protein ND450_02630 [Lentzea sp. HUAS12]